MSEPSTVDELRKAQVAEYGTYVALGPIDINGTRAFNAGDPVPVSHVERGVVGTDQVAKTSSKAGQAIAVAGTDTTPKG
ncbi:hypothetical protein TEK04_19560 [Klenkia sp. LSe6-5]|uniref:Uncharacterized protein n=1 Tax=Klenkia sesuvii TaxID=3103137 RepID=A0ABU8DYL5_9ACTN